MSKAQFGGQGSIADFAHCFGNYGIKHEQVYADPLGMGEVGIKMDFRPELANFMDEQIQKKVFNIEAGGAGTAGFGMIPIFVDGLIVDQNRKFTPIQEIMQKVANQGTTADFNVLTAKGAADFLAEDAPLTDASDTFDRTSIAIKYAYAVGRTTGQAQSATPAYTFDSAQGVGSTFLDGGFSAANAPTAMQLEVLIKNRALAEEWEQVLVNGNASSTPTEFSGIVQTQSTTNKIDMNTTALTMDDIHDAVKAAYDDGGMPNIGICDSSTYKDITLLLEDHSRTPAVTDIFGVGRITIATMVGNIPIIPSQFLSTTSGSKSLYFLDLTIWEQRMLLDTTFERLAKTNDSDKFFLKKYGALICRDTGRNGWVGEIA